MRKQIRQCSFRLENGFSVFASNILSQNKTTSLLTTKYYIYLKLVKIKTKINKMQTYSRRDFSAHPATNRILLRRNCSPEDKVFVGAPQNQSQPVKGFSLILSRHKRFHFNNVSSTTRRWVLGFSPIIIHTSECFKF